MSLRAHPHIDPIPSWAEHEPNEIVTHAIQIFKDVYILHIKPRYAPCFLCSQAFDEETQEVSWLHMNNFSGAEHELFSIVLTLCDRLIHGDSALLGHELTDITPAQYYGLDQADNSK